jgi:hypothetical protein
VGAAGQVQREALAGVAEVHGQQVGDPAEPVGHGVAVQVQSLRGPDDRALLVQLGGERADRGVTPGRAELVQRSQLRLHRRPRGIGRVPLHRHALDPGRVVGGSFSAADEIAAAGALARWRPDLVVLDCMGFGRPVQRLVAGSVRAPVLLPRAVLAGAITALL